jgi:hypothetical protein
MSSLPPSFNRQLGDLPDHIYDQVSEVIHQSTIPIILNKTFLGSGTLVKLDGLLGILTAEHVLNPPDREKFNNDSSSQVMQTTDNDGRIGARWIKVQYLDWWRTSRENNQWGPDLGFILLPAADPFTRSLDAKKTFCDLSFRTTDKLRAGSSKSGFFAFAGYIDEERRPIPPSHGFDGGEILYGYAFPTGPRENPIEPPENGYDYIELGTDRASSTTMPNSFGGVSGGGLWKVEINSRDGMPGNEELGEVTFCGVVYYEYEINTQNPYVRCHGPVSVYERLVPDLRTWLKRNDRDPGIIIGTASR